MSTNQDVAMVRIDWRKDDQSDFIPGPPERAADVDREGIVTLNDVLGYEKYRIVDVVPEATGEESG